MKTRRKPRLTRPASASARVPQLIVLAGLRMMVARTTMMIMITKTIKVQRAR
jgi:hypothetical protein